MKRTTTRAGSPQTFEKALEELACRHEEELLRETERALVAVVELDGPTLIVAPVPSERLEGASSKRREAPPRPGEAPSRPQPVTLSSAEEDGARIVLTFVPPLPRPMTRRQREIAALVGKGHGNKGIARELNISEETVKVHLKHMYRDYGFASRAALARYAVLAFGDDDE